MYISICHLHHTCNGPQGILIKTSFFSLFKYKLIFHNIMFIAEKHSVNVHDVSGYRR